MHRRAGSSWPCLSFKFPTPYHSWCSVWCRYSLLRRLQLLLPVHGKNKRQGFFLFLYWLSLSSSNWCFFSFSYLALRLLCFCSALCSHPAITCNHRSLVYFHSGVIRNQVSSARSASMTSSSQEPPSLPTTLLTAPKSITCRDGGISTNLVGVETSTRVRVSSFSDVVILDAVLSSFVCADDSGGVWYTLGPKLYDR